MFAEATGAVNVTVFLVKEVRSCMIMASAPSGTGAPVMIRAAFPSVIGQVGTLPAGITSVTSKVTGCSGEAAAVSA